jgi:hypothetical protein
MMNEIRPRNEGSVHSQTIKNQPFQISYIRNPLKEMDQTMPPTHIFTLGLNEINEDTRRWDGSSKFDKNTNLLKDMTFKINEVLHEYKDL